MLVPRMLKPRSAYSEWLRFWGKIKKYVTVCKQWSFFNMWIKPVHLIWFKGDRLRGTISEFCADDWDT